MEALRRFVAQRLPCYYGWVIFALVAGTNYAARPLMSVAVLSVFLLPVTEAFGWSRGLLSGAVSLGGLCGVIVSPMIGRLLDRYGSAVVMSLGSAIAGACAIGLSGISQVWTFYALYMPGRMAFASPLELSATTALSNWFIRRRSLVLGLFGVTQGTGLAVMPLVAQWLISTWGWRHAWLTLGVYTLIVGVLPTLLFMARRPEDMGLPPDPALLQGSRQRGLRGTQRGTQERRPGEPTAYEPRFTLSEALHTRAFWVLAAFSATGFMAQAGVSLHQVSHYIQQGFTGPLAAAMASTFALAQVPAGLLWSACTRWMPIRWALALAGLAVAGGAIGTALASTLVYSGCAAALLGTGVGGLHLLLRLAWAEYYGRQHLGTIQGVTLPVQLI
ncbi:MAG: MFS transporter, partial [Candidatus Tectomicrobia bacterium]|nr:MFS transporter [Candidatus Tectomicrobia bacterium]